MTETKKKVNAVFMAVLMVLSVVAVSAAFTLPRQHRRSALKIKTFTRTVPRWN
ncbi:hypothetical protein D8S78_15970 [Natrialba swarupiae]|nr:hypothetical protein [Natrialba swarupiae]